MTKNILVHEPKGDGTRDRGEEQYYLVCSNAGIRKARGFGNRITVENFPMEDIVRVDCFRGNELMNNMASGAAAGLLLGGATGAVIGGMLNSGSSKAWWIEIELKDQSVRYFRLHHEGFGRQFLQWAEAYNVKVEARKPAEDQPTQQEDVLSQVEKLSELWKSGVLTDDEFNAKKAELLERL